MERIQSAKRTTMLAPLPQPATLPRAIKEERFAYEYLKCLNATQAAITIGVPPKGAHVEGSRLLKAPKVKAIIERARIRLEDRTNVTLEKLLAELGKVAFASMQDFYTVGPDGQPVLDMSKLTPEQWAAVGEITTDEIHEGKRVTKRTRFKLHDKLSAIDKAMRRLGGYGKDQGGGEDAKVEVTENTVVYTLNIGTANIQVNNKAPAPKLPE